MQILGTTIPVKLALAGVAAVALFVSFRGVRGIGETIGAMPFDLVDGVVTGGVNGAGRLVGVPETDDAQCARDIAAGNTWDASFSCPAKTWIASLFK